MRVIASHNLSYVISNVAASLSKLGLDVSGETVTGVVQVSQMYVLVRWEWLILPAALVAAGLDLFLATVLRTAQHHNNLWRSSLLPLLFHRFGAAVIIDEPAPLNVARMEFRARLVELELREVRGDDEDSLRPASIAT